MPESRHAAPELVRSLALSLAVFTAVAFVWLGSGSTLPASAATLVIVGVSFGLFFVLVGTAVGHGLSGPFAGRLTTSGLVVLTLAVAGLEGGIDSPALVLGIVAPLMALVLISAAAAAVVFLVQLTGYLVLLLVLTPGTDPHWMRAITLIAATGLVWVLADILWRESAGLSAELEHRDRTDPLTGVANRRAFFEALRTEAVSPTRSEDAVALVLIEIDAFHELGEQYGNRAAERCTGDIAQFLTDCMRRETDTVARLAAGEFGVVLPATTVFDAQSLVSRAMTLLRDVEIPYRGSEHGRVTLSVGVAGLDQGSPDLSVARAREALDAAKLAGGNRAVSFERSGPRAFPQPRRQNTDQDVGR